jgi:hypothetical protein
MKTARSQVITFLVAMCVSGCARSGDDAARTATSTSALVSSSTKSSLSAEFGAENDYEELDRQLDAVEWTNSSEFDAEENSCTDDWYLDPSAILHRVDGPQEGASAFAVEASGAPNTIMVSASRDIESPPEDVFDEGGVCSCSAEADPLPGATEPAPAPPKPVAAPPVAAAPPAEFDPATFRERAHMRPNMAHPWESYQVRSDLLNAWLRGHQQWFGEDAKPWLAALEKEMTPAAQSMKLYRAIPKGVVMPEVGGTLEDPAFMSASKTRAGAQNYANRMAQFEPNRWNGATIVEIEVPKGTPLFDMENSKMNGGYVLDEEVVIGRGAKITAGKGGVWSVAAKAEAPVARTQSPFAMPEASPNGGAPRPTKNCLADYERQLKAESKSCAKIGGAPLGSGAGVAMTYAGAVMTIAEVIRNYDTAFKQGLLELNYAELMRSYRAWVQENAPKLYDDAFAPPQQGVADTRWRRKAEYGRNYIAHYASAADILQALEEEARDGKTEANPGQKMLELGYNAFQKHSIGRFLKETGWTPPYSVIQRDAGTRFCITFDDVVRVNKDGTLSFYFSHADGYTKTFGIRKPAAFANMTTMAEYEAWAKGLGHTLKAQPKLYQVPMGLAPQSEMEEVPLGRDDIPTYLRLVRGR